MLLPAHVEALRCRMVGKLWEKSFAVGPLPELMSDIMAFIPKPMLTLDCPMEEIVVDIADYPKLIFVEEHVVYAVFSDFHSVSLHQIYPAGKSVMLGRVVEEEVTCYYNASTSHLYVLTRCHNVALLDYDVKAGKAHKTYEIPVVSALGNFPDAIAVFEEHCFLAISWFGHFEVLYIKLGDPKRDLHVISSEPRTDPAFSVNGLFLTSLSPLTVSVAYHRGSTRRSVELQMVSDSCPTLFVKKKDITVTLPTPDDTIELPITGSDIFLCPSGDDYCLRSSEWRTMSESFKFGEWAPYLLDSTAAADDVGSFHFIISRSLRRRFIDPAEHGEFRLLRAHPYLR